jgi:kynurenine 3-monooxygenase
MAVASPSSSSSSTPAQQAVEEEEKETLASNEVIVVGAGPAGCLLAIYLLRRGFSVNLFEKREATIAGPGEMLQDSYSYSMVLSSRATKALEGAGLALPLTLLNPLEGACRHFPNGKIVMFPQSHTVKENSWITKKSLSIALFYNLTGVF